MCRERGSIPGRSHSHRSVPFHNARFTGETAPVSQQSQAGSHPERRADEIGAERVFGVKSWRLVASAGGEAGAVSSQAGTVEWKSSRVPGMAGGTAKLKCWVVGALSSWSPPPGVQVPLLSVSRGSPDPSVRTCGLAFRAFLRTCPSTPSLQSSQST